MQHEASCQLKPARSTIGRSQIGFERLTLIELAFDHQHHRFSPTATRPGCATPGTGGTVRTPQLGE